jgi:Tfp pilus assembly protein PilF
VVAPKSGFAERRRRCGSDDAHARLRARPAHSGERRRNVLAVPEACSYIFLRDEPNFHATAAEIYQAAPKNPVAIAFYTFASQDMAWFATSPVEQAKYRAETDALIEEAFAIDPDNPEALNMKAMYYAANGDRIEQQRTLEKAMRANADFGHIRHAYSDLMAEDGRTREAVDHATRFLAKQPSVPGMIRTARMLAALGDFGRAGALYDRARRIDRPAADRHELLSMAWYGDVDAAGRMLKERRDSLGVDAASAACLEATLAARRGEDVASRKIAEDCAEFAGPELAPRVFALAGDRDGALLGMERLLENPRLGAPGKRPAKRARSYAA